MKVEIKLSNKDIPFYIEVPNDYDKKKDGVEYGKIETLEDTSENCIAKVLLPPNYNENEKYPALYLITGAGADEEWIKNGNVQYILGNLSDKIQNMIVVMPKVMESSAEGYDKKIKDFTALLCKMSYLIKRTQDKYSVIEQREHRYIAGASLGGATALYISFMYENYCKENFSFSTIGAISPSAKIFEWWCNGVEKFPFDPKLTHNIYLATGTLDPLLIEGAKRYQKVLKKDGFDNAFSTIAEKKHDWNAFKPLFYAFVILYLKCSKA